MALPRDGPPGRTLVASGETVTTQPRRADRDSRTKARHFPTVPPVRRCTTSTIGLIAVLGVLALLGACGAAGPAAETPDDATLTSGAYAVGDEGPGGGTVFYVAEEPFPCGENLEALCTHLEVSPPEAETALPWVGRGTGRAVDGAHRRGIGEGAANSLDIERQGRNETSATGHARSYTNRGHGDWYLPSLDELNELCKYANHQTTGDPGTSCHGQGNLRTGFADDDYWSSTQLDSGRALLVDITLGGAGAIGKPSTYRVRPIRAF